MSAAGLFKLLPQTHVAGPLDYNLGFFNIFLTALVLTTPCTPGWKLFRMAIGAPVVAGVWVYLAVTPISANDTEQFGIPILMTIHLMRTIEWLLFFPPEEHCHRLRPRSAVRATHLSVSSTANGQIAQELPSTEKAAQDDVLVPEPVPPPFTWAKFCWAFSLWCAWRGIGWNYCCPLSSSAYRDPYARTSTRRSFFKSKIYTYVLSWLIFDLARTYMNVSYASAFFSGRPGIAPSYDSLTTTERAFHSIAIAIRIWYSLVRSHIEASLIAVSIGGLMGWESEMWSPWGWPSLFGSLGDLWRHPGLSTMWSRTWQGNSRRWLYVLGWLGIGENILGLTHTGISSHPRGPVGPTSTTSSRNSPSASGAVSPSHPLPSGALSQLPRRSVSPRLMVQNLIKSLIVFVLSGLNHDVSTIMLMVKYPPAGKQVGVWDLMVFTPFFAIQPLALALEAGIKSAWRGWKVKYHPEWRKGGEQEPQWLVFAERAVGFAWTWIWLGVTARWFVEGCAQLGAYRRGEGRTEFPSLFGGLYAGKWTH